MSKDFQDQHYSESVANTKATYMEVYLMSKIESINRINRSLNRLNYLLDKFKGLSPEDCSSILSKEPDSLRDKLDTSNLDLIGKAEWLDSLVTEFESLI
jgi:two-component SAPR family response regulator